jgi:hypothetical protein
VGAADGRVADGSGAGAFDRVGLKVRLAGQPLRQESGMKVAYTLVVVATAVLCAVMLIALVLAL